MSVPGYLNSVAVRADTTPAGDSDKIAGLKDFSTSGPRDMLETTNFKQTNADPVKTRIAGVGDLSADLSMDHLAGDAQQNIIRSAWLNGTLAYFTFTLDPSASSGSKGYMVPMFVSDYGTKSSPSGLCESTAKLQRSGASVPV